LHRSPIVVGFSALRVASTADVGRRFVGCVYVSSVVSVACADEKPIQVCSSIVSVSIDGATRAWSPVAWIHGSMDDCPCMHACQYRGSKSRLYICACIHTGECLNWREWVWADRSFVLKGKGSNGHGPDWSQIPASWSVVACRNYKHTCCHTARQVCTIQMGLNSHQPPALSLATTWPRLAPRLGVRTTI
jgi:hypothetical protein